MKIRLTTSMAGVGWQADEGEEIDRPNPEAKRLISAGLAVPARGLETASLPAEPLRTATLPVGAAK